MDINKVTDLVGGFTQYQPMCIRGSNNLLARFLNETIKFFLLKNKECNPYFWQSGDYIWCSELYDPSHFCQVSSTRKCQIFNYIAQQKYFDQLILDEYYYATNINEKSFTFVNDPCNKKISDPFCIARQMNQLDVTGKCPILCDVFLRKGILYCISMELLQVRVSELIDTTRYCFETNNTCLPTSDLLLFCFLNKFSSVIKQLLVGQPRRDNSFIHGIYKIKLEQVVKKYVKNCSHILDYCHEAEGVSVTRVPFDNLDRHRYYYYITPSTDKPDPLLADDELIELFKPKTKKSKKSKKKCILSPNENPEAKPETKSDDSPDEEQITFKPAPSELNIVFKPTIVNTEQIKQLILNLVENNFYFEKLYNEYGQIYIFKDYSKTYTNESYINFQYESKTTDWRKAKRSKSFHAYLTEDLSEISRVTYIENIEISR